MDARRRQQRDKRYKLVLLGESAVGKSSFVLQFVKGQFDEWRESTIGAAFLTQSMTLDDGLTTINFELWDTAGQERFHSLAPMYYRHATAAIVMYDITSAASLARAKDWVNELQRQASSNIIVTLIGNKLDLVQQPPDAKEFKATETSRRQVTFEEGKAFADENGLLFFEASAKTAENIVPAFTAIAKKISERSRTEEPAREDRVVNGRTGRVSLHGDEESLSSSCNC